MKHLKFLKYIYLKFFIAYAWGILKEIKTCMKGICFLKKYLKINDLEDFFCCIFVSNTWISIIPIWKWNVMILTFCIHGIGFLFLFTPLTEVKTNINFFPSLFFCESTFQASKRKTLDLLLTESFKGNIQCKGANLSFLLLQFGMETEPIPEDIEDPKAYRYGDFWSIPTRSGLLQNTSTF